MKTFILLTFGFLGFAFYQMSGGSEFEPASVRLEQAEPAVQEITEAAQAPAPSPTETATATASITKIDSTPSVTRVALNLTDVVTAAAQATQPAETPTTARILDSSETPQIILPSLITTTNLDAFSGDIRTVSGNSVNVRGGPSTNYGIVSKLERGETVRILEDNGDGWVRMQPLEGGEAGWMADFLLTAG